MRRVLLAALLAALATFAAAGGVTADPLDPVYGALETCLPAVNKCIF